MPSNLGITSPEDLKRLSPQELRALAKDIRDRIIETVSKNGGHLASSLGVVELTLALHTIFDAPRDKIVWDVGHQAYAHKLVTGRDHVFHTLRKLGGISGFPKRAESPYDVYDTGHASGSISYALGLAMARDLKGEDYHVVVVIGDGALTSGVAFEGLNNAGGLGTRLIVVVNDNSMSISENVGGLSFYFTALRMAPAYRSAKARLEKALDKMPNLGPAAVKMLRRVKGSIKHFLFPEAWFEALGFSYYGPIDGHDIEAMQRVFQDAKALEGPVIVHVVTKKGKGYPPAEKDPERYHGPGPFDPATGEIFKKDGPPAWNKVFGEAMCEFAKSHPGLVAITAAMCDGTGLGEFKEKYPDRFFDVGIAESHAVTYAAGLAQGGLLPVVAIYSTFLQRSYDQIVQDVAQQNLKVVFAIDRAGLVGEDGETHHGEFDLSYLRTVPGMVVMAPKDERELVNMLFTALKVPESCAIRYPRGPAPGTPYRDALANPEILEVGKGEVLSRGKDANILAVGSTVYPALQASEILSKSGVSCGVANARFVKPLDREMIGELLKAAPLLVVEENVSAGGLGEAVLSEAARAGHRGVAAISLPDAFVRHGSQTELRKLTGLDAESIAEGVRRLLKEAHDR